MDFYLTLIYNGEMKKKEKKNNYTRICISNDFTFVGNRKSSLATSVTVLMLQKVCGI